VQAFCGKLPAFARRSAHPCSLDLRPARALRGRTLRRLCFPLHWGVRCGWAPLLVADLGLSALTFVLRRDPATAFYTPTASTRSATCSAFGCGFWRRRAATTAAVARCFLQGGTFRVCDALLYIHLGAVHKRVLRRAYWCSGGYFHLLRVVPRAWHAYLLLFSCGAAAGHLLVDSFYYGRGVDAGEGSACGMPPRCPFAERPARTRDNWAAWKDGHQLIILASFEGRGGGRRSAAWCVGLPHARGGRKACCGKPYSDTRGEW